VVVSQNFILGPAVNSGKRIHAPQYVLQPLSQDALMAPPLYSLQAFLERYLNGLGERLTRFSGNLSGQALGFAIFYAQRHL
jgi:hypothetical protein